MTIKALYPNVRPTLNLNFARTKTLDPRVTFSRASTATYMGSNGLIQTAASNAPRFDHNPSTGESLGLLVEDARTNLIQRSGQIGTSPWGIVTNGYHTSTVEQNSLQSPDGTLSATKVTITRINNDFSGIYQDISSVTGDYTFSAWMRLADGVSDKNLQIYSDNAIGNRINVTLTSAWKRLTVTFTGGTYTRIGVGNWYSSLPSNWIDSTPFYIWGAQLEAGSFPTSYIPTTSATVTRAADVASMTGTNFTSWYNYTSSTCIIDGVPLSLSGSPRLVTMSGTGGENRLWTNFDFYTSSYASGGGGLPMNTGYAISTTSFQKYAYAYDYSLESNLTTKKTTTLGLSVISNTASGYNIPLSGNALYLAGAGDASGCKWIKRFTYYSVRLPDAQLQALTA